MMDDGRERLWCIAVSDFDEPLTGTAHLMIADPFPADDIISRYPLCGQYFGLDWLHIPAEDDNVKCKKCLKIESTT